MDQFVEFAANNLWLCIVIGVLILIVGDEVFGVTKGLFGDDADDYGFSRSARKETEEVSREAQQDFPDEDATVSFDDLMGPDNKR